MNPWRSARRGGGGGGGGGRGGGGGLGGGGLTPRGVKQLIDLGIDTRAEAGWLHNRGLRVLAGGYTLELDWPDLATFPPYGVVRPRADFDELLARTAQRSGAR